MESQDAIDPEPSQLPPTERQNSYWSRANIQEYYGVLAWYCCVLVMVLAVIWGFPDMGKPSPPHPTSPWNVLRTQTLIPEKFDTDTLELA